MKKCNIQSISKHTLKCLRKFGEGIISIHLNTPTDEAKLIFSVLDANGNNRVTAQELLARGKLIEAKLANGVFKALDTNGDGELVIFEYLPVGGDGQSIDLFWGS